MLKAEIEGKKLNSWDNDNSILSKLKKKYETQFLNNLILNDKIKIIKKKIELLVVEIKKKYLIKKGLPSPLLFFIFFSFFKIRFKK